MACSRCGKNISMSGAQICGVCDPDMEAILARSVEQKTPELCDECFELHMRMHKEETKTIKPSSTCDNCGSDMKRDGICHQCGQSDRIG